MSVWRDVPERLQRQPSWFDRALVFVGADLTGSGDEAHARRDAGSFAAFKQAHAADYAALDKECEALTEDEVYLGTFEVVEARSGT